MVECCRIFGNSEAGPELAQLCGQLQSLGHDPELRVVEDGLGWYRARIKIGAGHFLLERFLAAEEGIRAELNSWAAWVESTGDGAVQGALMEQLIAARQVVVIHDGPSDSRECLCRLLAEATAGVYQIDGHGFFSADGRLLLAE